MELHNGLLGGVIKDQLEDITHQYSQGFLFVFFVFLPFSAKWVYVPRRWGAWVEV